MALINHNTTLEYATNTIELNMYDDAGVEENFDPVVTFNIERIDDSSNVYSVTGTVVNNVATFVVTPPVTLQSPGDSLYDYENPTYEHIYSIKSSNIVYISGKLNLVEVAG